MNKCVCYFATHIIIIKQVYVHKLVLRYFMLFRGLRYVVTIWNASLRKARLQLEIERELHTFNRLEQNSGAHIY